MQATNTNKTLSFLLCCLVVALPGILAPVTTSTELTVYPSDVLLAGHRDEQRLVAQLTLPNGETRDVTNGIEFHVESPQSIVELDGNRLLPKANGTAIVVASIDGLTATTTVSVNEATHDPDLSFRLDVMPVLMQSGCNAGRCHGAARGQDGFHLSLFGYDAAGDYYRLTREISGRRINLARPHASLLLTKAIGEAPHTGGQRFSKESGSYRTLLRWITEGAKDDVAGVTEPIGIELFPPEAVLLGNDVQQRLVVVARYKDGSTRDITDQALYLSNNDNSARIDTAGVITSGAPGEAFVMARFATFTEGIPVIVVPSDGGPEFHEPEAFNDVDRVVYQKLRKLRITPSEVCTDERFLRRAYLDLTGLTPTREQYERFLSSESPNKREELIDQLLATEEFVDVWTMRLGELLRIRTSNQVSYKALLGFHNWVRDQVAANRPLDELLADVLSSSGGTFTSPPTNYFQIEANTLQLAENVAQTYMGMRVQCARCHNHPFDRWTMNDYYGFAAFFSQVGFKQSGDPREFIVYNSGQGEMTHFVDGREVEPKYLGGGAANVGESDRRKVLAEWIVSDANRAFSQNLANVVWAHHFGRGIVEPVDDVRISNPPSNQALLDLLADKLVKSNYDLRALVREICMSRTYQLSTHPNATNASDRSNFSKADVRRIRAEALLDSISLVTGTTNSFPRLPAGARAAQISDGAISNYFLTTFGRAPRETVCACEVDVEPNLSQAFHLLNGDTTNEKVRTGGLVESLLADGKTPADVVEHLYLLCYSRRPNKDEMHELTATVDKQNTQARLEDIFWALLNSKEFVFNH